MPNNFEVIKQTIINRRSRQPALYIDKHIDFATLEEIFNCAGYAPTHKKTQPWKFIVYQGNKKASFADELTRLYGVLTPPEKFSEAKSTEMAAKVHKANAVALIVLDAHPELLPEWEEVAALSAAVGNMWLACTALGIGCYWSSPGLISKLDTFLKLEENQRCLGIFYLGYSDVELPAWDRKKVNDFVRWELD